MLKGKSVREKVTRRVVAALVITILSLSVVTQIYLSRRLLEEQKIQMTVATQLCAENVEKWQEEMKAVTTTIADVFEARGQIEKNEAIAIVDSVQATYPDYIFVYVGTETNNMYMSRNNIYPAGVDVRERPWYKAAKQAGKAVMTDPYMGASIKIMEATATTPIYVGDEFIGAVGIDAGLENIEEVVSSFELQDGAYAFLMDSKGNIVFHPNEEYMPKTDGTTVNAAEVIPEISPMLEDISYDITRGRDYQGTSVMYDVAQVGNSGWKVGVALPRSAYMSHVKKGITICIFMAVLCIFFAILDMSRAIQRLLKPLDKINPAMDKMLKGDFTSIISFSKETDELGQLQNQMAEMVRQLSDMINEQKFVLSEIEHGNLAVEDMDPFPGELNEISTSVNHIKEAYNDIVSDIQFSAINLESYAVGINEDSDMEEMQAVFTELATEADSLMEKTSMFITTTANSAYSEDYVD
ncbi:MAG: hypothetical protein K5773_09525 [Pseudobutyrivibrio sp.]|nr:hypothetical protein [Pseudobutyrivibrio sp.]